MKLKIIRQKSLDCLQKDIIKNVDNYRSDLSWIDRYFIEKNKKNYMFDTGIEIDDYQLIVGGPNTDFQNAKTVYEVYKDRLNPVFASDLRLWAYLAHTQHWEYMHKRWGIENNDKEDNDEEENGKSSDKMIRRIKDRFFFGASKGKSFVRNGIARLYWSSYLTYDEKNDDPYEYTKYMFEKQDIFTSITERSYARNKIIILAVLKELKANPKLTRNQIRAFLMRLNQAGAITVLDFLNTLQAEQLCKKIMNDIMDRKV